MTRIGFYSEISNMKMMTMQSCFRCAQQGSNQPTSGKKDSLTNDISMDVYIDNVNIGGGAAVRDYIFAI